MCIDILTIISPNAQARISPGRLAEMAGLSIEKTKFLNQTAFRYSISGGCSCEFLGKEIDFDSTVWQLNQENLDKLAKAIEILGHECKKYSFIAYWINTEIPRTETKISTSKLAAIIRANKVGNNVLYNIG